MISSNSYWLIDIHKGLQAFANTVNCPIISPRLIFVQKAFLLGLLGCLFSEGLVIGRNFASQNGFGLPIKTAEETA